jgi:hypothetical protein
MNGAEIPEPGIEVGPYALSRYRTVDADISLALGLPLAPSKDRLGA